MISVHIFPTDRNYPTDSEKELKMGRNFYVIILILLVLTMSCEKTPNAPGITSPIIVQAYLYANEPANDIRIRTLGEDNGFNSQTLPVNNAGVSLIKQEIRYKLKPSPGDSGYYFYPGSDLIVAPDDTFKIEVAYQGNIATGQTIVPNVPKIMNVSADTFFYSIRMPDSIKDEFILEWITPQYNENELYFAKVDYIWREPGEIYDSTPLNIVPYFVSRTGQHYQNKWSFNKYSFRNDGFIVSYKPHDNYSNIREGWYCFYINQVTQDFIDLYETKFNYWGEPGKIYSNIENGFGIFTAFGVDSVYFYAKSVD